jgi:hypothetical protein
MKETYRHEFNWWQHILGMLFGMWRINKDSVDFKWGYFAPKFGFELMLYRGGYFDQRYAVSFCPIWGVWHIKLPMKTRIPESCDTPRYGVQIHGNAFWIHLGGKMNSWEQCDSKIISYRLPFVSWEFEYHKQQAPDGSMIQGGYEHRDSAYTETHSYKYVLRSGEEQNVHATCLIEEWCHHRKWLPFVKRKSRGINIDFSGEVGEETGSWKGGTVGCRWDMEKGETIEQCLRRMERERKF